MMRTAGHLVEAMAQAMWDSTIRNRNALWDMDWKDGAGPSPSERAIMRARARSALACLAAAADMDANALRGSAATLRARKMGVVDGNPRTERQKAALLLDLLAEAAMWRMQR
jgi:hypothetical protein